MSVLQLLAGMSAAAGRQLPYVVGPRRPGDLSICYASTEKAGRQLGWTAEKGVDEMCADTWRWQSNNPMGYASAPAAPAETAEAPAHAPTPTPAAPAPTPASAAGATA